VDEDRNPIRDEDRLQHLQKMPRRRGRRVVCKELFPTYKPSSGDSASILDDEDSTNPVFKLFQDSGTFWESQSSKMNRKSSQGRIEEGHTLQRMRGCRGAAAAKRGIKKPVGLIHLGIEIHIRRVQDRKSLLPKKIEGPKDREYGDTKLGGGKVHGSCRTTSKFR